MQSRQNRSKLLDEVVTGTITTPSFETAGFHSVGVQADVAAGLTGTLQLQSRVKGGDWLSEGAAQSLTGVAANKVFSVPDNSKSEVRLAYTHTSGAGALVKVRGQAQ